MPLIALFIKPHIPIKQAHKNIKRLIGPKYRGVSHFLIQSHCKGVVIKILIPIKIAKGSNILFANSTLDWRIILNTNRNKPLIIK